MLANVDEEMLECFRAEAGGVFETIDECLEILADHENNRKALEELARAFHTLKGSSGLVGLTQVQRIAGKRQDELEALVENDRVISSDMLARCYSDIQRIKTSLWQDQDPVEAASAAAAADPATSEDQFAEDHSESSVDPELVEVFLEEAGGYLPEIADALPSIAETPERETLESLARLFHTLKGSAGIVGLIEVSEWAKEANDVLQENLDGNHWDPNDLCQFVAERFENICSAVSPATSPEGDTVEAQDEDTETEASRQDFEFFLLDARENLDEYTKAVLELEAKPGRREIVEEIFRASHTIKGAASLVGARSIQDASAAIEDLLDLLVQDKITCNHADLVQVLFDGADTIAAIMAREAGESFDAQHASRSMAQSVASLLN